MSIYTNNLGDAAEEAEAYIKAILDMLGERDPKMVLEAMPEELEAAAAGLNDEQLHRPEAPGKWSVVAVIQHMADSEVVWANRLRMIVAHDRPEITGYDQDAWADKLKYNETNLRDALMLFSVLRAANLRLIKSLDGNQLKRVGLHSERGEESVEHMIKLYAGHDLVHLAQIERIKKGLA